MSVTLISNDGRNFPIDDNVVDDVLNQLKTIASSVEDCGYGEVPLPNISGNILEKVLEYCNHCIKNKKQKTEENCDESWDKDYFNVDNNTLFSLILAANYLEFVPLLDSTCKAVANQIRGKSPEKIREHFGIENDFTPEEEAAVRKENLWMMED